MGLGKTLTMIALILIQKNPEKNKEKDKNTTLAWLSKDGIQVPSWPVLSYSNRLSQWRVQTFKLQKYTFDHI